MGPTLSRRKPPSTSVCTSTLFSDYKEQHSSWSNSLQFWPRVHTWDSGSQKDKRRKTRASLSRKRHTQIEPNAVQHFLLRRFDRDNVVARFWIRTGCLTLQ